MSLDPARAWHLDLTIHDVRVLEADNSSETASCDRPDYCVRPTRKAAERAIACALPGFLHREAWLSSGEWVEGPAHFINETFGTQGRAKTGNVGCKDGVNVAEAQRAERVRIALIRCQTRGSTGDAVESPGDRFAAGEAGDLARARALGALPRSGDKVSSQLVGGETERWMKARWKTKP